MRPHILSHPGQKARHCMPTWFISLSFVCLCCVSECVYDIWYISKFCCKYGSPDRCRPGSAECMNINDGGQCMFYFCLGSFECVSFVHSVSTVFIFAISATVSHQLPPLMLLAMAALAVIYMPLGVDNIKIVICSSTLLKSWL